MNRLIYNDVFGCSVSPPFKFKTAEEVKLRKSGGPPTCTHQIDSPLDVTFPPRDECAVSSDVAVINLDGNCLNYSHSAFDLQVGNESPLVNTRWAKPKLPVD